MENGEFEIIQRHVPVQLGGDLADCGQGKDLTGFRQFGEEIVDLFHFLHGRIVRVPA